MFKKHGKSFLDKETPHVSQTFPHLATRPPIPFTTDIMNALSHVEVEESETLEPETIIAEGVCIKGTITFKKLLRIDGSFEGELVSTGKVIIGPTGSVKANLNLEEAFISGKIVGDINVTKRLILRGRAEVRGDITAPLLSVDEGVCIIGILNIAQTPPAEDTHVDPFADDHYSPDH